MGLWDDSYVVITSDHGESLGEHGIWEHGMSVYQPELHVPLILRWPKRLPAGRRVAGTVQLIDVMPTLIDHLGLAAAAGLQGRSLMPDIDGRAPKEPVPAFAEGIKQGPEQQALYVGSWKLIHGVQDGHRRLFELATDPEEQRDRASSHPQELATVSALLDEQARVNARLAAAREVEEVELSAEQQERLKALGYLQ
jgi:arylsulfatase A-like enzyme